MWIEICFHFKNKNDAVKNPFINLNPYRLLRSGTDIPLISPAAQEMEMGKTSLGSQVLEAGCQLTSYELKQIRNR